MRIVKSTPAGIAEAAEAIKQGEVVVYPTETVYGLAVNPFDPSAVERLFEIKGRDEAKPILLVVADNRQLERVALPDLSAATQRCMEVFWPGPLSLLFPKSSEISERLTAGKEKVGVRCPACRATRNLCRAVGHAITSTSANRSGEPPIRSLEGLDLPGVAVAIDEGHVGGEPPSTIFDPDLNIILREGAITRGSLMAVLGDAKRTDWEIML